MAFPNGIADFRSDTVTHPTDEMRAAMAGAVVGDDVYGEDPTVNALEEDVAALLGKAAALFVTSGTMANQIGIGVQTSPGDEVVCVSSAHVRQYENGGASANFGVAFRTVESPDGEMTPDQIETASAYHEYHLPRTTLLTWENTHNVSGGTVIPLAVMRAGSAVAHDRGLRVHLDGARLWNAVIASGTSAADYASCTDTVMFCFSKGLGAPVGSILVGSRDTIARGRAIRQRLGGGMRQAGVIAAAARVALAGRDRLAADHDLAATLSAGLTELFPGAVTAGPTNMVLVDEAMLPWPAARLEDALRADGILVSLIKPGVLRFCTHHNVDATDVARVLSSAAGVS